MNNSYDISTREICEERNPALVCNSDSASTSSDLISEIGSIADSDLMDVDLELAAVTAPAQVVGVSVHQGSVEVPPAIDAGQGLTMDNVIPSPLFAALITCAHAPPLASTSNQLLLTSAGTAAPLLVMGPSFPLSMQGPISMLPGAPIAFSGAPGAPQAPYRALRRRQCHMAPCTHYSLWQVCHGLVSL